MTTSFPNLPRSLRILGLLPAGLALLAALAVMASAAEPETGARKRRRRRRRAAVGPLPREVIAGTSRPQASGRLAADRPCRHSTRDTADLPRGFDAKLRQECRK